MSWRSPVLPEHDLQESAGFHETPAQRSATIILSLLNLSQQGLQLHSEREKGYPAEPLPDSLFQQHLQACDLLLVACDNAQHLRFTTQDRMRNSVRPSGQASQVSS